MDKKEFINHLTKDIIPFWNKLIDKKNGGFYGYADEFGNPDKKASKGVILNHRILWFYSNAYLLLKDESLLEYANHAYSFSVNHCLDSQNGGVYWSLDYLGNPMDTEKHTYNQAFAIYALSSYSDATKNKEALYKALEIYKIIEDKCRDKDGYLECFTKEFAPAENEKLSENGVMAIRTMNTLLHILEAYTELYKVSKNEDVKRSLYEALYLFKKYVFNEERKICEVFFDKEYHTLIDLESFGHEIEASWLIERAISVLEDEKLYEEYKPMILALALSPYERGMDENIASMYYESENGIPLKKRAWWVMAEGVTGFYNAYRLSKDERYLKASSDMWEYIKDKVIDKKTGEWIEDIWDDESKNQHQALVHPWKCPYHNGRMCIEMVKRLESLNPVDDNRTKGTQSLYDYLTSLGGKKVLFGHQNTTFIRVSDTCDSDVRELTGELPALFGIDTLALAGAEMNPDSEEDSLAKSIEKSIEAYNEGCIITLSAHMPNFSSKRIYKENGIFRFNRCDFLDTKDCSNHCIDEILPGGKYNDEFHAYLDLIIRYAKALDEKNIPVIFRPYHEQNGKWFWWGAQTKKESYIKVFRYTKEYFLSKGVHNVLYVYSPNGPFKSVEEYMDRYPGDDIIDIMALDYYDDYLYHQKYRETFFKKLDQSSQIVYQCALMHDKQKAISEVGIRVAKDVLNTDLNGLLKKNNPMKGHHWFTTIADICIKYNMPYYLVWGNFCDTNTYLPYKGHEMVPDFLELYHYDKCIFSKENKKNQNR